MAWKGQPRCIIARVVSENKRKMLSRLDQRGMGSGTGAHASPVADVVST